MKMMRKLFMWSLSPTLTLLLLWGLFSAIRSQAPTPLLMSAPPGVVENPTTNSMPLLQEHQPDPARSSAPEQWVGPMAISISKHSPLPVIANAPYTMVAEVSPPNATKPLTFTWQTEGQEKIVITSTSVNTSAARFTWETPGLHRIAVTAVNRVSSISAGLVVTGIAPGQWRKVQTKKAPSARFGHTTVGIEGKVYLFGGKNPDQGALNDIWVYQADPPDWTEQVVTGVKPPPRYKHAATKGKDNNMYVFFGRGKDGQLLSDVWSFKVISGAWTQKHPHGKETPAPRELHTASPLDDGRIIVTGGKDDLGIVDKNIWYYDPKKDEWSKGPECPPAGRYGHIAAPIANHFYIFGGNRPSGATNELWVFEPNTGKCYKINPKALQSWPPLREFMQYATNGRDIVWTFGGQTHDQAHASSSLTPKGLSQETWALYFVDGEAWWAQESLEAPPLIQAASAYISETGQTILFGGRAENMQPSNDTWAYTAIATPTPRPTPTPHRVYLPMMTEVD